jgi:hypothetical protein
MDHTTHLVLRATPIGEITADLIWSLVTESVEESQDLEFKGALALGSEKENQELRKDVLAMANGGGGTIIFGVAEDGHGRATKLQGIALLTSKQAQIESILQSSIEPPLTTIDVRTMTIDGHELLIMRIAPANDPPYSFQKGDWSRAFPIRQGRRVRAMSMQEIRQAMQGSRVARDITVIRQFLESGGQYRPSPGSMSDTEIVWGIEDAPVFEREFARRTLQTWGNVPLFRLLFVPDPLVKPEHIRRHEKDIKDLMASPPGARQSGWFIDPRAEPAERRPVGLVREDKFSKLRLTIAWNGSLLFEEQLDTGLATWGSKEVNGVPVLNALSIMEPIYRMFALTRAITKTLEVQPLLRVTWLLRNASKLALTPFKIDSPVVSGVWAGQNRFVKQIPVDDASSLPFVFAQQELTDKNAGSVVIDVFTTAGFDMAHIALPYVNESGIFAI